MASKVCCHGFNSPHLSNFNGVLAEASAILSPLSPLVFEADGFVVYVIAPSFRRTTRPWIYAGPTTVGSLPRLRHQNTTTPKLSSAYIYDV